jgi:hypothetical protein
VDVGERSIIFEALVTPSSQERWVLRVRYAEGAQPEWAVFALVAAPGSDVDLQVTAIRPRQALDPCQAQLAAAQARCTGARAEVWVLADRLGGQPVQVKEVETDQAKGTAYRLGDRLLLVLTPMRKNAAPPWTPTGAVLRSSATSAEEVPVLAVHSLPGPPGEWGEVAVEAALPSPAVGSRLDVELRGERRQSLTVKGVWLPEPAQPEKKESGR